MMRRPVVVVGCVLFSILISSVFPIPTTTLDRRSDGTVIPGKTTDEEDIRSKIATASKNASDSSEEPDRPTSPKPTEEPNRPTEPERPTSLKPTSKSEIIEAVTRVCSDLFDEVKSCATLRSCCKVACRSIGQHSKAQCSESGEGGSPTRCQCDGSSGEKPDTTAQPATGTTPEPGTSTTPEPGTGTTPEPATATTPQPCDPDGPDEESDGGPMVHRGEVGEVNDTHETDEPEPVDPDSSSQPTRPGRTTTRRPIKPGKCPSGDGACGKPAFQPASSSSRIMGGKEAAAHSWPWQISLRYAGAGWKHICGGSIIDQYHILTAAHCVEEDTDASNYQVGIGLHDRQETDGDGAAIVNISQISTHPNRGHGSHAFDAALIRVSGRITFSKTVMPVCLPQEDVAAGTRCTTTGWGRLHPEEGELPRKLMQVEIPILDRKVCDREGHGQFHETMICAKDEGKSGCMGDSGGPLVCQRADKAWELHGITSWGSAECALSKTPTYFGRVVSMSDWIKKTIKA